MIHRILLSSTCLLLLGGCQSAYYNTMEKFGVEKRDILVDRVEDARDAQQETKEEFASAFEEFSALVNYDGGDLEKAYDKLKSKFESSEKAATEVRKRIEAIESVAAALFREWESEIEEYSSDSLRRKSRESLQLTRSSYAEMLARMRAAEARMYPVLDLFRDQVLFLKHNLNARAITSLDAEAGNIETQVKRLIQEMEASIAEADAFIATMR